METGAECSGLPLCLSLLSFKLLGFISSSSQKLSFILLIHWYVSFAKNIDTKRKLWVGGCTISPLQTRLSTIWRDLYKIESKINICFDIMEIKVWMSNSVTLPMKLLHRYCTDILSYYCLKGTHKSHKRPTAGSWRGQMLLTKVKKIHICFCVGVAWRQILFPPKNAPTVSKL